MTASPAIEGWFTTGDEPALIGSSCTSCGTVFFPKVTTAEGSTSYCRNPHCTGTEFSDTQLSRTGTIWSYTDAQYQPPAPYPAAAEGEYTPFALAAVALPEGITVLGQLAAGVACADVQVGDTVELVLEPGADGATIWKWKPVTGQEGQA